MGMENQLVLETPRVATLGHRIIATSGFTASPHYEELLNSSRERGSRENTLVATHTVTQRSQSGITGREGVERLVLISPWLHQLDQPAKGRLIEHLSRLLESKAEELLADSELIRKARGQTLIEHHRLDEWLEGIRARFFPQEAARGIPAVRAEAVPISDQPQGRPPGKGGTQPGSAACFGRKKKIAPLRLLAAAGLLGLLVVGIGFVLYHIDGSRSYEGRYEWLPEEVEKPKTKSQAERFDERLNECWEALTTLISENSDSFSDWARFPGIKKIQPVRAWLLDVSSDMLKVSGASSQKERFQRIQKYISEFQKSIPDMASVSSGNAWPSDMECKGFLEQLEDARLAGHLDGAYAELDFSPVDFFDKARELYSWEGSTANP